MVNRRRILQRALAGGRNLHFSELIALAEGFGFQLVRVSGSHHIYVHPDVATPINLQDVAGQAKPYQVRQLLKLIEQHQLRLEDET
jgi:predicted RNA binding protein YcfA (HicA-like mRNA interferase family)